MAEMYDDDYDLPPKGQVYDDEAYNQQTHHVDQLQITTDHHHQLHNTTDMNNPGSLFSPIPMLYMNINTTSSLIKFYTSFLLTYIYSFSLITN